MDVRHLDQEAALAALDEGTLPFEPRGAVLDLFTRCLIEHDPPLEASVEGPAGTGKSRGILELLDALQEEYPGARGLICRQTRRSMTESILVTLETKVWPQDHPCLEGPQRSHRQKYVYPNGSEIILGGLDNPTRLFSTEFDWVYINEALEISLDHYELLFRSLRNGVMPFQCMLVDTNPGDEHHWLNKRPDLAGSRMERYLSRHADNPVYFDRDGSPTMEGRAYLERLGAMSGVRKERMLHGRWVTAEGLIYDCYDPSVHLISPGEPTKQKPFGRNLPRFEHFICSCDWGFRAPGSLQLWGIDRDGRMFLLREWYEAEKPTEWWAERFVEFVRGYKVGRCVCDPAEPDRILLFNDALTSRGQRKVGRLAVGAANEKKAGIRLMYDFLNPKQPGGPRMFFCRDAVEHRPPDLDTIGHPVGVVEEITGYVWDEEKPGRAAKEEPMPGVPCHGCDAARYACNEVNDLNLRGTSKKRYATGTHGDWLDH